MPPLGKVPVPGKVSVPINEESSDNRKILIAIAAVLGVLLLILLLLLVVGRKTSTNAGGGGQEMAGMGAGNGEGMGDGEGNGMGGEEGNGMGDGEGDALLNNPLPSGRGNEDQAGTESDEPTEEPQAENPTDDDIMIPGTSTESESPEPQAAELKEELSTTDLVSEGPSLDEQQAADPTDSVPPSASAPGGGGGGAGGGTRVRVFGVEGYGRKFVYVFDRSGSMAGQKLEEVKKELLRSFSVLNNGHQFDIIFYDDRYVVWKPKLIAATPQVKKDAETFVQGITSGGGTSHLLPLLEAIKLNPDVIFFLTDGQSLSPPELEEICRRSGGISINVIQYDDGGDGRSEILRQLAVRNQGRYKYINVRNADAL